MWNILDLLTCCRADVPICPVQGPANPGEPVAVNDVIQYAHYFTRIIEELMSVLFDVRRHTCHSLVLNYFVAGGGLKVLVQQFAALQQLMWQELEVKEGGTHEQKSPTGEAQSGCELCSNDQAA